MSRSTEPKQGHACSESSESEELSSLCTLTKSATSARRKEALEIMRLIIEIGIANWMDVEQDLRDDRRWQTKVGSGCDNNDECG
mmetsp:Transcript_68961/g.109508  ORF Transcript_68961/g.109508 Transcript_68961/m.109508 type:complete len:84 (+) Transcript_68961:537-788(+)